MNPNLNYQIKVMGILIAIMFIMFYDIAEAQYGSRNRERRRTRRRTAVVVSSETHAQDEANEQQKNQQQQSTQSTQTQTQNDQNKQQTTTPPPPATTSPGGALAIGTVVSTLPSGCTSSSVDNVEYYHCGPNWYRSAFQGNTLVYVTTDPPQ